MQLLAACPRATCLTKRLSTNIAPVCWCGVPLTLLHRAAASPDPTPQLQTTNTELQICELALIGRAQVYPPPSPPPLPPGSGGGFGNYALNAPVFASSVVRKGFDSAFSPAPFQRILTDGRPMLNDTLTSGFCVTTAKMVSHAGCCAAQLVAALR